MRKCPFCAEEIQSAATKCKHCGEMVSSTVDSPSDTSKSDSRLTARFFFVLLLPSLLGLIFVGAKIKLSLDARHARLAEERASAHAVKQPPDDTQRQAALSDQVKAERELEQARIRADYADRFRSEIGPMWADLKKALTVEGLGTVDAGKAMSFIEKEIRPKFDRVKAHYAQTPIGEDVNKICEQIVYASQDAFGGSLFIAVGEGKEKERREVDKKHVQTLLDQVDQAIAAL